MAEAIWIEARSRWQVNVQQDGKRKTFTSSVPGRKGKHEAEQKADDWLEAGQPDDMRFDTAWGLYLDHLKATTGTAHYRDNEGIGRNWLLPALSGKRLSKIRASDVQTVVDDAFWAGRSKRTCKNIKDKFFSFCAFACSRGWDIPAKAGTVVVSTQAKEGKRNVAQPDKLRILFTHDTFPLYGVEHPVYYIHAFRFLVSVGCRSGELCGLKKVDYDGQYITINRAINKYRETTAGKTKNAQRIILLSEHAKQILKDQAAMLEKMDIQSEYLFPQPDGLPCAPQLLWGHWRTYNNHYHIGCSIHELRHTFVSMMTTHLPMAMLKDIVGHSANMDTDHVYAHEIDGDKKRAANIIDEVMAKHLSSGD